MVSELFRNGVRPASDLCPDWFGTLSEMRRNSRFQGVSDAGETARVSSRSVDSIESPRRERNSNGTKETTHASNPRNPSTQISKPALDPRNRTQLRCPSEHHR